MKTENMTSTNGNKVANQFIITDDNGNTFFQSYSSIIVKIPMFSHHIFYKLLFQYRKIFREYPSNIMFGETLNIFNL